MFENVTTTGMNTPSNIQQASTDTANLILSYTGQIKLLWILLIIFFILLIIGLVLFFWLRKNPKYRILIHFPSGSVELYKRRSLNNIIRIKHTGLKLSNGQPDVFDYIVDQNALTGRYIQYFYRNPDPIIFDTKNFKISTLKQNIDQVLETDVIQKFVMAHDIVGFMKIALIVLIVINILLAFGLYLIYNKNYACMLNYDNTTIEFFKLMIRGG